MSLSDSWCRDVALMLSHRTKMEGECSLDEFAKVLAEQGYINDVTCFTDLPSVLSAFDAPDALDSPDNFHPCTYEHEDLSRVMETGSPSLLDAPENVEVAQLAHAPITGGLSLVTASFHRNAVVNPSCQPLTFNLYDRVPRHSNMALSNAFISEPNSVTSDFLGDSRSHLPHVSHFIQSEDSLYLGSIHQPDFSNFLQQTPAQPLVSPSSTNSSDSVAHFKLKTATGKKQKRKRKSKGYSKPSKSRRKDASTEVKPRQKKAKTTKAADKPTTNDSSTLDLPHDDSGFESGEIGATQAADNKTDLGSLPVQSEGQAVPEETRTLRRSSRATRNTENYNLRLSSLVKRVETERRQEEPRLPKGKIKPPPLSKYRRRTANARERDRMKEINDAFDNLKSSLPHVEHDSKNKVTKFTILKLALNYIASLRDMLGLEVIPLVMDDDVSSDMSSLRPASVTSSGGEESCSSPTSAHSETDLRACQSVTSQQQDFEFYLE
ncbi:uncharacterized protein LOC131936925 [Physella acuta]|uniref:uncharacterized protein LOC131936925 n=1 Tax=Physella acuta TaxID=109671 RepID=UPI0027DDB8A4|nr:uncharacterized protein LOC131936925 [Physella acuta]